MWFFPGKANDDGTLPKPDSVKALDHELLAQVLLILLVEEREKATMLRAEMEGVVAALSKLERLLVEAKLAAEMTKPVDGMAH